MMTRPSLLLAAAFAAALAAPASAIQAAPGSDCNALDTACRTREFLSDKLSALESLVRGTMTSCPSAAAAAFQPELDGYRRTAQGLRGESRSFYVDWVDRIQGLINGLASGGCFVGENGAAPRGGSAPVRVVDLGPAGRALALLSVSF